MNEIEHDGKKYILKSDAILKTQVEQMIKDRVSKVSSKVTELEKVAQERLETINTLQEKQTSYDSMSEQLKDVQSKLKASQSSFKRYQSISKLGITNPELIEAIEWQYDKSHKDVDKDQMKELGEWLSSYMDNPSEAPITIRPHLEKIKNGSHVQQPPAAKQEQQPEQTQQTQQETPSLISSNVGAVRAPEGEDAWKKATSSQDYYNENYQQVQDLWMKRYARRK